MLKNTRVDVASWNGLEWVGTGGRGVEFSCAVKTRVDFLIHISPNIVVPTNLEKIRDYGGKTFIYCEKGVMRFEAKGIQGDFSMMELLDVNDSLVLAPKVDKSMGDIALRVMRF